MKYTKPCSECGHIEVAYTHHLNVGKVKALRSLVDFYEKMKRPAKMKELALPNSQYTNFGHLAYWDLAMFLHGDKGGWIPTEKGIAFIYGRLSVLVPAGVMFKKPLEENHEAWKTHTKERTMKSVKDIDELSYKQKEEYQEEKSNTLF